MIDKLILKIPLFGGLILRSEMAGMCDTLATLVNAGIPIVEGLERCINASSNELTRRTLSQGINLVQQGQELNYSLGKKWNISQTSDLNDQNWRRNWATQFCLKN